MTKHIDLAERFYSLVEQHKLEAVRELFAPDAEVWHNIDQEIWDLDHIMESTSQLVALIPNLSFRINGRYATDSGFVQEHVVTGNLTNGTPVEIFICAIAEVSNGKITKMREYVDSAQFAQLMVEEA